jgi:hypothetical protein
MTHRSIWAIALLFVSLPTVLAAQGLADVGPRAPAMAAFVAVADDVSAVTWNPAGFVFGPLFNLSLGIGRLTSAAADVPRFPAVGGNQSRVLLAVGVPPLGISYLRTTTAAVITRSPAGVGRPDRQDEQVFLRSVTTSALGATVLQSVGDYITVGGTIKVVRGGVGQAFATVTSWDEGFEVADRLSLQSKSTVDADIGTMVAAGRYRAGLVVRNATSPTIGDAGDVTVRLRRHGRVGVAWGDRWPGQSRTIAALDVDLTRVADVGGDRRDVAAGAERWLRNGRLAVRAGVRASTAGTARPVVSGGLSYAVRAGTYVDGHVGRGREGLTAWGLAVRVSY